MSVTTTYKLPEAACYPTTTVKAILEVLEKCPNGARMLFDFAGFQLGDLQSYRGYYECLSIEPILPQSVMVNAITQKNEPETVASFYLRLSEMVGKEITGYKGGEYLVTPDTAIWVSFYGRADSTAIHKIKVLDYGDGDGTVWLCTKIVED